MRSKGFLVIILLLTLSLPVYVGCNGKTAKESDAAKAPVAEADEKAEQAAIAGEVTAEGESGGIKAANFSLSDMEGKPVNLSDYAGKVIILDFWATWCPPCVKEIPHFNDLSKEYGDKGLVVIGVSVDRGGKEVIEEFLKKTQVDYTIALVDKDTYGQYQSYLPKSEQGGIPFTFVIDRKGVIRHHYVGYREKDVFIEAISPLL
ncbi:MAG: redoxin domain-containing protein [Calditrichaeota bacterium]|nr:redoxin domain-containing protein [Calditrichota bacterium]